jgi:hypothetical protein
MKTTVPLLLISLLLSTLTYAQQPALLKQSNSLTIFIREHYHVLKSDKTIKQGEYTALNYHVLVAKGNYTNGDRTGIWNFYNAKGKLVQTFNYDNYQVLFNDTTDVKDAQYFVEKPRRADTVTIPIKIGGLTYGLEPLIFRGELSRVIHQEHPNATGVKYKHTFILDDRGQITAHEILATVDGVDKLYKLNDDKFDADITRFKPATLNHRPVKSVFIITSYTPFNAVN